MMVRPAPSTPRPLPQKRKHAEKPSAVASADMPGTASLASLDRPQPETAIQKNEALADSRQGRLARLDALRIEIRALVMEISHAADIGLLDLMVHEVGSFARHKTVQEMRTWATTAGITLETGLMQLGRALPDSTCDATKSQGGPA